MVTVTTPYREIWSSPQASGWSSVVVQNEQTTLVSVIIPAYNAINFLERAVDSVLSQTWANLEIVIINDSSEDETFDLARELASQDSRIRVLNNPHNLGISRTLNRGIDAARGDWIAPLDQDDLWLPKRLEKLLGFADEADVVSDDLLVTDKVNAYKLAEQKGYSFLVRHGLILKKPCVIDARKLVYYNLGMLKPLIRRSFLRQNRLEYDGRYKSTMDFHLYLRILVTGAKWIQIPEAYYVYHWHGQNKSADALALAKDVLESTEDLLQQAITREDEKVKAILYRRYREWQANEAFALLFHYMKERRGSDVLRVLAENPEYLFLSVQKVERAVRRRILWQVRRYLKKRGSPMV